MSSPVVAHARDDFPLIGIRVYVLLIITYTPGGQLDERWTDTVGLPATQGCGTYTEHFRSFCRIKSLGQVFLVSGAGGCGWMQSRLFHSHDHAVICKAKNSVELLAEFRGGKS